LPQKTFEEILLEATDDALAALGDSARQSIYFHLERKFKIARSQIPYRLEDFEEGLERIFGEGSQFLEVLIMKKLYERIGSPLKLDDKKELVFLDYVNAAKKSLSGK
jgi:hypothetical protein